MNYSAFAGDMVAPVLIFRLDLLPSNFELKCAKEQESTSIKIPSEIHGHIYDHSRIV